VLIIQAMLNAELRNDFLLSAYGTGQKPPYLHTVFCYFNAESIVKASLGLFPQPFLMTSTMDKKLGNNC